MTYSMMKTITLFLVTLLMIIVTLGSMSSESLLTGSLAGSNGDWPVGTFVVKVNGDASPNQFTIKIVSPGGGTATPASFSDDGTGTPVTLSGGGTFEMAPNTEAGYTRSLGDDCMNAFSSSSLPQRFECTITFTQIGLVGEELPLAEQLPQMSTPSPSPPAPSPSPSPAANVPPPQQKPGTGVCDNNGNGLLDTEELMCMTQLCGSVTGKLILADPSVCDTFPSPTDGTATTTQPPPPPPPTDGTATTTQPPPPPPPTDGTATTTQPPPPTTPGSSSLNASIVVVKLNVINEHGGTRNVDEFLITVLGNDPKPIVFQGSPSGTIVSVKPGFYSVVEFATEDTGRYERPWGYGNFAYTSGCKGEIKEGETRTCTIYVADNPDFPWSDPDLSSKGGFK
jgi:hypothetical protein